MADCRVFRRTSFFVAMGLISWATFSGCAHRVRQAGVPPPPRTYPAGVAVAGVPVGGMTEERARETLRTALQPLGRNAVTLRYGTHAFGRSWDDLGIRPDVDGMLRAAWDKGAVPLSVTVDAGQAKRSVRRAGLALDIDPVAPRFVGAPGKSATRPGKVGRKVVPSATVEALARAVAADPNVKEVPLYVVAVEPSFTEADLRRIRIPVARYTTVFNPGDANRTYNLRLVARRLNGALVKPGGTFSFNDWVGERRKSDGFRDAIVYKRGKMVKDLAGGLCQVSSTLYNVALVAGLPIVQRSHHTLTVHYVPLGRDATVYWGHADLRFQNNTGMPLYIRTRAGRRTLTVEAWGDAPLQRKVVISTSTESSGNTVCAEVYRVIAENGRKKRELVSRDVYSTEHVMAATAAAPRT